MNESIMIEVDKTTENILNMIEARISTGSLDAMAHVKDDIIQELESNIIRINLKLDESLKRLFQTSEEAKEQTSTDIQKVNQLFTGFQASITDKFTSIEKKLKEQNELEIQQVTSLKEEIKKYLTNEFIDLRKQVNEVESALSKKMQQLELHFAETLEKSTSVFHENVKLQLDTHFQHMNQVHHKLLNEIEEKLDLEIKSSYSGVKQELQEKTEQNLRLMELVEQMTYKLEKIEAEIARSNQPFYKKWFTKGSE